MVSQAPLCLCSALFVLFISSSLAYDNLYVGDKDGWVVNPSESYRHWAKRNRFQVNDNLVFKYKEGSDSVLQVSKADYHSCDNEKPIRTMTTGESVFRLDHSGSFYFISGKEEHCHKGQKLNVVVLAVGPSPASPTIPSPASQPPLAMPPQAPSPATPAPSAQPPAPSPTSPPATWPPAPAPSPKAPWSKPPALSPTTPPATWPPAPAPSPKAPWSQAPSPQAGSPTVSPSPQPAPIMSPSPEEPNTPSPSPVGKDVDIAPAPAPSHSRVLTPSHVSTLLAVILIILVMGISL